MTFQVPVNQSVSWSIFWPSVVNEAEVTIDEAERFKMQIMKGFDMGEPIWMAALTLKQYVELNRDYKPEKTPLELAKRVVRM